MVKKISEGTSGEDLKPKYEPIDYEEELDFSLRVPSRNTLHGDDATSVKSVISEKTECEIPAPTNEPVEAAIEAAVEQQEQPPAEHKVTVMVHRPGDQVDNSKKSVPGPDQHVTVIKLGSNAEVAGPASAASGSFVKKAGIPLLPPPPASNKTRVPHQSILKPTPVSPQKPKTIVAPPITSTSPTPAAASAAVSSVTSTTISAASVTSITTTPTTTAAATTGPGVGTKSKSLPRGLPSDGSAFASFNQAQSVVKKVSSPIDEEADETNLINIEELQMEALRLKLEFDELMAVKSELEQRKRSERKEMEYLREEIATMQTLYQYR
jgi:hypothetical protein